MKIAVFSTKPYDRRFLNEANARHGHELSFFEPRLNPDTARLAEGNSAVCAFVNDPGAGGRYRREVLSAIAETTLANVTAFESGRGAMHRVSKDLRG